MREGCPPAFLFRSAVNPESAILNYLFIINVLTSGGGCVRI